MRPLDWKLQTCNSTIREAEERRTAGWTGGHTVVSKMISRQFGAMCSVLYATGPPILSRCSNACRPTAKQWLPTTCCTSSVAACTSKQISHIDEEKHVRQQFKCFCGLGRHMRQFEQGVTGVGTPVMPYQVVEWAGHPLEVCLCLLWGDVAVDDVPKRQHKCKLRSMLLPVLHCGIQAGCGLTVPLHAAFSVPIGLHRTAECHVHKAKRMPLHMLHVVQRFAVCSQCSDHIAAAHGCTHLVRMLHVGHQTEFKTHDAGSLKSTLCEDSAGLRHHFRVVVAVPHPVLGICELSLTLLTRRTLLLPVPKGPCRRMHGNGDASWRCMASLCLMQRSHVIEP